MNRREMIYAKILEIDPYRTRPHNHKSLAVLFAQLYKHECRFDRSRKKWFSFREIEWELNKTIKSKVWQQDNTACVVRMCIKEYTDLLTKYAKTVADKNYLKLIGEANSFYHRENMLRDAEPHFFFDNFEADNNQYLFNCRNGTFDLKTFEFKEYDPKDLITKISNVFYNPKPNEECVLFFEKFINDIMSGNKEKAEYLQKCLGYALTGGTQLETCFILYGATTRNGKSTLVETISYMMGEERGYALGMSPDTLGQKHSGAIRSDLARLAGCRFLNASEPPKKMIFDISILKTLLGRDTIVARKLYENEISFIPVFKLFINTNYLPHVNDDTVFTSGRINVITFDRHFKPDEQDKNLKDKLKEPDVLSAIFNWCVEGLKKFNTDLKENKMLTQPKCVKDATEEYREQSDKLKNFILDCLIEDKSAVCPAGEVYNVYREWCESSGFGVENKSNFFAELKAKNLLLNSATIDGKTVRNVFKGYKLQSFDEGFFDPVARGA